LSNLIRLYLPYLCVLTATLLWSSSFIALKLAFEVYDPMVVIFGRMFIASVFILLFLKPFRAISVRRGDIKFLLLMALCEPCLYFIFEAIALKHTSASQAGMITAMLPLIVAVTAWLVLKEQLTWPVLSGFLLAIAGVVLLTGTSEVTENAPNPLFGNTMEFLAMVSATGYIILMKQLSRFYSSLFITAFQALVGSVFYLPLLFLPTTELPTRLEPVSFGAVVYLGLFVTFGAYGAYNFAVSKIPASRATAFINLIPVFTLIMGVLILGDQLSKMQYLAVIIVLAGVAVSQYRPMIRNVAGSA
jgi:drug/metabolite transporter (DMT)-like permease